MLHLFVIKAICEVERNHSMGIESIGVYICIRYRIFQQAFLYQDIAFTQMLIYYWVNEMSWADEMKWKKELKMCDVWKVFKKENRWETLNTF